MLIGKAMPLYDLEHADPIFARLFAFAFLVVCNVNLMNMFITMMMDSHGEAAGVDRNSERFGVSTFMTERLSEWIYGDKQAIGKKNEEQDTRKKSAKPNDSFNENSATEEYQRVATSSSIGRRISRGQELRPENPKYLEPLSAIPFAMVSSVTSLQKNVVTQQMLNVDDVEATVSTQPNPPVLSHTVRLKQKQQSVKTQRVPNFDNHETKVAAAISCVPAMVGRALGVEHIEPIAHAPPSADLHEPVGRSRALYVIAEEERAPPLPSYPISKTQRKFESKEEEILKKIEGLVELDEHFYRNLFYRMKKLKYFMLTKVMRFRLAIYLLLEQR